MEQRKRKIQIIIFGKTFDKARLKMLELKKDVEDRIIKHTIDRFETDIAVVTAVKADMSVLGRRADRIYVDEDLTIGFYNRHLKHALVNSTLFPEEGRVKFF